MPPKMKHTRERDERVGVGVNERSKRTPNVNEMSQKGVATGLLLYDDPVLTKLHASYE